MIGDRSHVGCQTAPGILRLILSTENLASHRVQQILAILPTALVAGVSELEPTVEPLKASITRILRLLASTKNIIGL